MYYFALKILVESDRKPDVKTKSNEDEQTLADLSSAHRLSQTKCQLLQTSSHIINILKKPT